MTSRVIAPLPSRGNTLVDARRSVPPDDIVTAAQTYKNTWDHFYSWKAEYNRLEMDQLCVGLAEDIPAAKNDGRDSPDADDWCSEHSYPSSYSPSELATELDNDLCSPDSERLFLAFEDPETAISYLLISVYRELPEDLVDVSENLWCDQSFKADSYQVPINSGFTETSGKIDPDFLPHPRYFSCTSTSRNLTPLAAKSDSLAFSPFEDDVVFDHGRYLRSFLSFDWQSDFLDPDVEVIQLEVVRRLYHGFGLSFSQIDEFHFFTKLRSDHDSGLLWDASQRDLLSWPGARLSDYPDLHVSDLRAMPPDADLSAHLRLGSKIFCPNLNCIYTSCGIHRNFDFSPSKSISATSHQLQLSKGNPCGNDCFRHLDLSDNATLEVLILCDEEEMQVIKGILEISPDILPCDLSVIVHAKCRDVFIYRTQLYADDTIEENIISEQSYMKPSWFFEDDPSVSGTKDGKARFSPLNPCHHKGACGKDSGCACFLNKHHCQRNCQCRPTCVIRWKGCSCSRVHGSRKKLCSTDDCPCRATGRECDPEMCRGCDARKSQKQNLCFNVHCQRAQFPHLYIARGSWGLGAFTTQKILHGEAIGEYTGELQPLDSEAISEQASPIPYYTGLNYKFDLNDSWIVDSMYMGNEMRFLNHEGPILQEATDKSPNCRGRVVYVNNCHHIMFFADRRIEAGSELFIDYGVAYWTEQDEWTGAKEKVYWR